MRANLNLLSALVLGTLGGVLAVGCQTYDFEEVEPLAVSQTTKSRKIEARQAKPNLMLLVDTSGSMTLPVDENEKTSSGVYVCREGGKATGRVCGSSEAFPCDTTRCPTRWTSLQDAMKEFLASSGSVARIGLTTYPQVTKEDAFQCGSSTKLNVPLPEGETDDEASLVANAQKVNAQIQAIKNNSSDPSVTKPVGGTPTNGSLQFVGNLPELNEPGRSNFVLLLTDGLPNCNPTHPTPYPACECLLSQAEYCKDEPLNNLGCLDKDGSVSAVTELLNKKIKTIVVGFGAELATGTGTAVLNEMAKEGGFSRSCTQNSDCGAGDSCNKGTGLCNRAFYQAANKDQLAAALRKITEEVGVKNACLVDFSANERPSSEELVVVFLNGERIEPGSNTWKLTDEGITFQGSTCQRIESSTSSNPVNIEVRAVRKQ